MSDTRHHRGQKHGKSGWDYGKKFRCNRTYAMPYGPYGKEVAHSEMRGDSKTIVLTELNLIETTES